MTMAVTGDPVVLASQSSARRRMLEAAGVAIIVAPAGIDETSLKTLAQQRGDTVERAAEMLALAKSVAGGRAHPNRLVVGSDQMLECEGRWYDKPRDLGQARDQLRALSGRTHRLVSAVAVTRGGAPLWRHTDAARLTVRRLGDEFLDRYLAAVGDAALASVGAYQLEGLGAQLFDAVEGDYFTVLGMPLLPLLGFLRGEGVLAA